MARSVLDSGKCVELSGDRVLAALTQYEALLPDLLSDLNLALETAGRTDPHFSRAQLNAAVLWSAEWGLENHALARQVKSAARKLMEQLRAGQVSELEAHADACVGTVADWDWRSNRLGKPRFDRDFAPPAINVLDSQDFDFKVTSGAPACVLNHTMPPTVRCSM